MKLSEAVEKVIDLSRKVNDYYEAELPKWHPNYPLVYPGEPEPPPPPERQELKDYLESLPDETVFQLLLLKSFGFRSLPLSALETQYQGWHGAQHARDSRVTLLYTVPLGDYLSDALEKLKADKISVDRLPLKRVKTRK